MQRLMQFKQSAGVFTARGREVGPIGRVVVDPRTKTVTHIVILKGVLFTYDRVVPIHLVAEANEHQITLGEHAVDPYSLAPFEAQYAFGAVQELDWPAGPAGGPPSGVAAAGQRLESEKNIPRGTVALKQDAVVITVDGGRVGSVERVFTDATRATHLIVSHGLLTKERRLIPIAWVSAVSEDEVHLSVEQKVFERLSAHHSPITGVGALSPADSECPGPL